MAEGGPVNRLVCFGLGYSSQVFARRMLARGWQVFGTTRSEGSVKNLCDEGFDVALFTGEAPGEEVREALSAATHALVSIAPGAKGDAVLAHHGGDLASAPALQWIGYLSTVGVYGDHGGEWVDEEAALNPKSERSIVRVAAEKAWVEFGSRTGKAVQLFRLAGIYGPGRGPLETVRHGKARRIVKRDQVFNRIHVEDIASVLEASIAHPRPGAIYNVCDDEPAPPQDVVAFAAEMLGVEPPPEVAFEDADLSPMGRSFYGENKRVSNARIKHELGVKLACPSYREGIRSLAGDLK
jgi:nucleoside-diphosphate-sugar epimerase